MYVQPSNAKRSPRDIELVPLSVPPAQRQSLGLDSRQPGVFRSSLFIVNEASHLFRMDPTMYYSECRWGRKLKGGRSFEHVDLGPWTLDIGQALSVLLATLYSQ